MRSIHGVAVCVLTAAVMACGGGKKAGEACVASDDIACESALNVLACVSGTWAVVPCGGAKGCTDSSTGTFCDLTVATAGQACPPWAENNKVCQFSPHALLVCSAGVWSATMNCTQCSAATGEAVCTGATVVGSDGGVKTDGGSANTCTSANCTGCCSSTGVCIANRTASACGTNGAACVDCGSGKTCDGTFQCATSVGCGPSNCTDGCCANGQCVRPPMSPTDTACGPLGGSCSDCSTLGLVCNPTLRSCQTTSSGGTDAGDACQGVPVSGECLSTTVVRFCAVSTGAGGNTVKSYACTGGASCVENTSGATCVSSGGSCTPDDQRCSANLLQECNSNGTWSAGTSCSPGTCNSSALGAFCAPLVTTVPLTATLKYQARSVIRSPSGYIEQDWSSATTDLPASNVVVRSTTGTGASLKVIDSVTTDANGQYTVKVPATPTANDRLVFSAVGGDTLGVRFAVADPGFGEGEFQPGQDVSDPRLWGWSAAVSNLSNGGTLTITTAQGSGAMNLFEHLQKTYAVDKGLHQGIAGKSVVMWFGLGTKWSCGACFLDYPGSGFETQVFMSGDTTDQSYWGDGVSSHELGHWAMATYGTSPGEGGRHFAGLPTFPGQAWSEGFATFHAAHIRNDPLFFDRQGGGMFWFDISTREYYPGANSAFGMTRTKADAGMLQQIDENDVAGVLFQISRAAPSGLAQIHNALASPHLNTSPYPGGYTRHTWQISDDGVKSNIVDTRQASMHLGDMLDALRCSGMAASFIDSATTPTRYYPYQSATPACRTGFCYGCQSGSTCEPGTSASACGSGGVACSVCSGTCSNGVCQ